MKDGWLNRHPDDDGNEVYSLTANALDGLKTVERLTKDRAVSLSSHLIAGLIRHLRDFSASVSPDVAAYIAAQQAEKARIQAEIDRVLDGGELADASDDEIIQGFTELQRYLDELPSDFSRVVESYRNIESRTISDFRADSISSGAPVPRACPKPLHCLRCRPRVRRRPATAARPRAPRSGQPLHRDTARRRQSQRPAQSRRTRPGSQQPRDEFEAPENRGLELITRVSLVT